MFHLPLRRRVPSTLPGKGLYAITDGPRADLLDGCARRAGRRRGVLQYRDKTNDARRRLTEARAIVGNCWKRRAADHQRRCGTRA